MTKIIYNKNKAYKSSKLLKDEQYFYATSENIESQLILHFGDKDNAYSLPSSIFQFLLNNWNDNLETVAEISLSINEDRYNSSRAFMESMVSKYELKPTNNQEDREGWVPSIQPQLFSISIDWSEEEEEDEEEEEEVANLGNWILRLSLPIYPPKSFSLPIYPPMSGGYFSDLILARASWNNEEEIEGLFSLASNITKTKAFLALTNSVFASEVKAREEFLVARVIDKENYEKQLEEKLEEKRIKKSRRLYRRIAHNIYFSFLTQKRQETILESTKSSSP